MRKIKKEKSTKDSRLDGLLVGTYRLIKTEKEIIIVPA